MSLTEIENFGGDINEVDVSGEILTPDLGLSQVKPELREVKI